MIRSLVLVVLLAARVASAQVTAPEIRGQFDSAGQSQRYTDVNGAWWTFTATRTNLGVIRLLGDGSPATAEPLVAAPALPVIVPPLATDLVTVATAAYLITGRTDSFPATSDRFRLAVRWEGWLTKDGDGPGSPQPAVSPWAVSAEAFTLVVTNTPPTLGTFTIGGGTLPRVPLPPGVVLVVSALTASPDRTRLPPAGQIVDAQLAVWTLNGIAVLRNGQATGGQGSMLTWCGGQIRTLGTDAQWWRWTGATWIPEGAPDPCGPGAR